MRQPGQAVYPVWEYVPTLGVLRFNAFGRWPTPRMQREIAAIVDLLTMPGRIPSDGSTVIGWPGSGIKPANAVDVADEAVMQPWRERAYVVRVERVTAEVAAPIWETERARS
jgi:hypothetical protein